MTRYDISGMEIIVPTSTENRINFDKKMNGLLGDIDRDFNKWYNAQGNCQNVDRNLESVLERFTDPIINKGIEILNQNDVYSIDRKIFIKKYSGDSADGFFDAAVDMMLEVEDIDEAKKEAKEYRKYRKASRGKFVGRGYDLESAIRAKAKAGALNMTTGAWHSMKNIAGNTGSAIAANANKTALFSKYKSILREELKKTISLTVLNVMKCIEINTNCRFDYLINGEKPDESIAKAIINNYKCGKISEKVKHEQLVLALRNCPNELEIYKILWTEYGDESGDLRKMAKFFGVPLGDHILSLAQKHCNNIFLRYCKEFSEATNPIPIAIRDEENLITARDEIVSYCEKQKIPQESIPVIKLCNSTLEEVEKELRTIKGIIYESREMAQKVKKDSEIFYSFLNGKNLNDENLLEDLKKITFYSDTYKNTLENIFQQEKSLRDPTKIFQNLKIILGKYFSEEKTKLGAIEFARTDGSLEKKESFIRDIAQMPENEIPIMLFNYSSNGKSGILLTNFALRIYSKGLFSAKNQFVYYHDILDLTCCGKNKYLLNTKSGTVEFTIKSGLSIKDQNLLCKFLQETIFIIKNLRSVELKNLRYINADSIKCICGTFMSSKEKICPTCFRMYTKEGIFMETISCRHCKNRIPIGKKFCNKCGNMLIDENIAGESDIEKSVINSSNADTMAVMISKTNEMHISNRAQTERENLSQMEQISFCPVCANKIKVGKRFCNKCGNKL